LPIMPKYADLVVPGEYDPAVPIRKLGDFTDILLGHTRHASFPFCLLLCNDAVTVQICPGTLRRHCQVNASGYSL
jgi:hypothetical protein